MAYNPYVDENGDYIVPGSLPGTGDIGAGQAGAPSVSPEPADSEVAPTPQAAPAPTPMQAPQPTQEEAQAKPQVQLTPGKPPAIDDIAAADKAQAGAIDTQQVDTFNSDMAQYKAKAEVQDQQSKVQSDYAQGLAKVDAHEAAARDQAHKDAAAETASWMQQMDTLSKQEPNRGRYWENQSGFGKAMWILGVAATAIANAGHPGMPNMALGLLQQEVQSDVQDQKDRLSRQVDQGKLKGKMMVDKENQRLTDIHDDFAKEVTRYGALRDAALTKAAIYPPGTQQNLAWTAAAQEADKARVTVAAKKQEQAVAFREKAITEAGANGRAALERANAFAIAKMHDTTTNRIADMNDETKKELAQVKAELALAKGGSGPNAGYEFQLPTTSGYSVVGTDANGKPTAPRPLGIKKEQQEKAFDEVQTNVALVKGIKDLRTRLADTSTMSYLINNDAALKSAIMEAVAPAAKAANGGRGPLTDQDIENGSVMTMGVGLHDFMDKIKTGDKSAIVALLDQKMADATKNAQASISSKYGTNLQPGETLVFDPEAAYSSVKGEKVTPPSAEEQNVKAGGKTAAQSPQTPEEYKTLRDKEAKVGPGLIKELPMNLSVPVNGAVANMQNASPDHIKQQAMKALKDLHDYELQHPDQHLGIQQAKAQLISEGADATEAAHKHAMDAALELASKTAMLGKQAGSLDEKELDAVLKKASYQNITPAEKIELIDNVNKAIITASKKHNEEDTGQPFNFDEVLDAIKERYK